MTPAWKTHEIGVAVNKHEKNPHARDTVAQLDTMGYIWSLDRFQADYRSEMSNKAFARATSVPAPFVGDTP